MTITPQWLKEYISDNLPSLNLPNTDYQTWFDDFIQTLESRGLDEPSQQKNYLTLVRNAIKALNLNHPALEIIKFSQQTWFEINEQDRDRITERTTKLIDNPDAIVSKAIELVKRNHWSDIAAGLAALTGRRCGEILKTAQFKYKTEYSVVFAGALKQRTEAVKPPFEIPVLAEANLIIKALDCLRLQLEDKVKILSLSQINQRYEERVSKKCDRHFSDLVPPRDGKDNLSTHLFRAVYAAIASHWYCPINVPEIEFRAAIKDHQQLSTIRHYFDYKIADSSGNIDGRLGIKLGFPGVMVIEKFQQQGQPKPPPSFSNPHRKKKNTNTTTTQVKSSLKPQSTMNTNQNSNSLSEPVTSVQLSLSRLESISHILNLSPTDTINTLVDWAEAGVYSAQHLNIDHPSPEALTERVQELEQSRTKSLNNETITHAQSGTSPEEHQRLLLSVSSLSNSVELLTKALVEGKSFDLESDRDRLPETRDRLKTNHTNLDNQNNKQKTRRVSSKHRERDTSEVMIQDINHAIDSILAFNNTPNRPHRQKFRLSIKTVADLTGRATNSISKILKERSEVIEHHHKQHNISDYHNKSRRDAEGNDYPSIESEPEINYQKITEIAASSVCDLPISSLNPRFNC